jgi:hypothetical protein
MNLIRRVHKPARHQVEWSAMLELAARLLIFSVAVCGFTAMLQTRDNADDADELAKLRNVLCREAWANATQFGPKAHPITVEGRTLVFYDNGTVLQVIAGDTGMYQARGTWRLEAGPDGMMLTVEGDGLYVLRGRCAVHYDQKADVMEFRYPDTKQGQHPAYRFKHVKGQRPPAPAAPNKQ